MNPEQHFYGAEKEGSSELRDPGRLETTFLALLDDLPKREKEIVIEALSFARQVHAKQFRDEGDPYIVHILRTAISLVKRFQRTDVDSIVTALLHDVLEDSETTREEIAKRFGDVVAGSVVNLSKNKKLSKAEMLQEYHDRLKTIPRRDLEIKLLDRLDNLLFLHLSPKKEKQKTYTRQTEEFYLPLAEGLDPSIASEMRERLSALVGDNNR